MATGDLHTKFCGHQTSGSRDMLADRQTDRQTHIQTDKLIAILRSPTGAGSQWYSIIFNSIDALLDTKPTPSK